MKYQYSFCIILFSIFPIINIFGNGVSENNPDEISDYFKIEIENNKIKPVSLLELNENEKYELILYYLNENENIDNYYYTISISITIDDRTKKYFTLEEYEINKNLPEYKDKEIERIEYNIWFYERFFNKYTGYLGNPTGKCFTLMFDNDNNVIKRYFWR